MSLFRKYRSQNFEQLMGQTHIVRTLQNSIKAKRHAQTFLFTGPRGTGKTSTARILAKALNCQNGPTETPCNECDICKSITRGNCIDVIEKDAASESGVDDVRETIVQTSDYKPSICRYKIFIIDEVHDLSPKAFDALLKTIEEPPSHIIFILATTEHHKVPPTIRSRCQKFEFHRATLKDITDHLKFVIESENVLADQNALVAIARMADGSFRDSLTILEKAVITCEGNLTLHHIYDQLGMIHEETLDHLLLNISNKDVKKVLNILDEVYRQGKDSRALLESLLFRLSSLTRVIYGIDVVNEYDTALESSLHSTAVHIGKDKLLTIRECIAQAHKIIRDISLPRIWLESELIQLCEVSSKTQTSHAAIPHFQAPSKANDATYRSSLDSKIVLESEPLKKSPVLPVDEKPSELQNMQNIWNDVVSVLSKISKTASVRLSKSFLENFKNNTACISFTRELDKDWVQDNLKIQKAIKEQWIKSGGPEETKFVFTTNNKPIQQDFFDDNVLDVPATGEKLINMAKEIFGSS